jgi:hypothetical protein
MKIESKESKQADPEKIRRKVEKLIFNFESELKKDELRPKVLALVPVFKNLRNLGKALIPSKYKSAARDRILYYFRKHPNIIIAGNELLVISGIQDYPRRLRELRVQFGWAIASGMTIRDMKEEDQDADVPEELKIMKPSDYVLLREAQDRDAAYRWNIANTIRKENSAIREKILKFLRANIGQQVTNEELRYVARNKTEWARRVRELRTEFGWPVSVCMSCKQIDKVMNMIGVFLMMSVARFFAVTNINVKNADGPKRNGMRMTPDTWRYITFNTMQMAVKTSRKT